mmetsp:Transcript_42601/g.78763  ORF Transcript_42601/g.78763 Transcript_42601/m.78763 type:complete len:246 (+) Transcript_42601:780-1517(+)
MDLGIVGVVELLEKVPGVAQLGNEFLGLADGSAHALGGRSEYEVGAEGLEQDATFHGHGFRHGQDELVPSGGGDHGESDAGIAGGRFDEGRLAGDDVSSRLRLEDHGHGDPILDGVGGVRRLELGDDLGLAIRTDDAVEADERSASDETEDGVGDLGPRGFGRGSEGRGAAGRRSGGGEGAGRGGGGGERRRARGREGRGGREEDCGRAELHLVRSVLFGAWDCNLLLDAMTTAAAISLRFVQEP